MTSTTPSADRRATGTRDPVAARSGLLRRLFLDHPESVDETYPEHFRVAGGVGVTLLVAGLACVAHALVPAVFKKTGSSTINRLHARFHKDPQREGKRPEWEI